MGGKHGIGLPEWRAPHDIMKPERDIEKIYTNEEFVAKLRRLADCIESGEQFEIQIAGERIYTPVRAIYSIEHEREGGSHEIEFQIRWDD
jgi:amphi-Trp domain-containing protein